MKLIEIIENLSDHYSYKIGINGIYQGTFNWDQIVYVRAIDEEEA